jgi:hypothetical protein
MNNIKCSECGLVNWADQIECKRCKALLTVQEKMAERFSAFTPEAKPFFSTGLKLLTALLGLTIVSLVATRILGLEHSDLAMGISVALVLIGLVLMLLAHLWLIIRIFEQSVAWGLGSLFIPLVGLIAIIKFWENTKRSFVGQLVCFGIMIFGAMITTKS